MQKGHDPFGSWSFKSTGRTSPRPVGLWDHERSSVYIVSKQGNRNLVLERSDNALFNDLDPARKDAERRALIGRNPWFVHEVSVKLMFSYRGMVGEVTH